MKIYFEKWQANFDTKLKNKPKHDEIELNIFTFGKM